MREKGFNMKKIVQLNVVCNGSTGKIMCDIAKEAKKYNYKSYCFFGRGNGNENLDCIKIASSFSVYLHLLLARLGFNGHGSYFATKKLVKRLKIIDPDVIHLHNIHGYYLNLKILFKYLKNDYKGQIVWTLHDCWAFTGHCAYFTMAKCSKWKKCCENCPQLFTYPKQLFDTTKREYELKKKLFTGINNITIVTPSIWLKDLVKLSFLNQYDVKVINNGVDLNIFKPTYDKNIYEKYGIPRDKKIILGVANIWENRKGLNDFLELNNVLDLSKYQIVLVGENKEDVSKISKSILCIERTDNAVDLAKIYTISTALFNPTYEDNYPTVNLESISCNTKVITYDTGGCKEQIDKLNGGYIIKNKDYNSVIDILDGISKNKKVIKSLPCGTCQMINEYIRLY